MLQKALLRIQKLAEVLMEVIFIKIYRICGLMAITITNKEALLLQQVVMPVMMTHGIIECGYNKLFTYTCYWNQTNLSDISKITSDKQNYFYGRTNNGNCAPSKYLLDCFEPTWDKRWENSFQTAFGHFLWKKWHGFRILRI